MWSDFQCTLWLKCSCHVLCANSFVFSWFKRLFLFKLGSKSNVNKITISQFFKSYLFSEWSEVQCFILNYHKLWNRHASFVWLAVAVSMMRRRVVRYQELNRPQMWKTAQTRWRAVWVECLMCFSHCAPLIVTFNQEII